MGAIAHEVPCTKQKKMTGNRCRASPCATGPTENRLFPALLPTNVVLADLQTECKSISETPKFPDLMAREVSNRFLVLLIRYFLVGVLWSSPNLLF
jgi:hypothetical protein